MPKGKGLSKEEVKKICVLLSSTEMTITEIAKSVRLSKTAVVSLNRRFRIRDYGGQRFTWQVNGG